MKGSFLLLAGCVLTGMSGAAASQAYPSKPVRLVVSTGPGPVPDLFARMLAPKLGESLGQPFVVENRDGAAGVIATEAVARAAPDGYQVLVCTTAQLITVTFVQKNVPYDPLKDLTPIIATVQPVEVLMARTDVTGSLKDVLSQAKAAPGKITIATAGPGSLYDLNAAALAMAAGVDLLAVPYKNPALAMQAAMAREVDMAFGTAASGFRLAAGGKVRVVGIIEKQRFPGMPDVPTVAEIVPNFEKVPSWFAMMGPAGLPLPIRNRLNAEVAKSMKSPDVTGWMEQNGVAPIASTPEQVTEMIRSGREVVARVVKQLKLTPQ